MAVLLAARRRSGFRQRRIFVLQARSINSQCQIKLLQPLTTNAPQLTQRGVGRFGHHFHDSTQLTVQFYVKPSVCWDCLDVIDQALNRFNGLQTDRRVLQPISELPDLCPIDLTILFVGMTVA